MTTTKPPAPVLTPTSIPKSLTHTDLAVFSSPGSSSAYSYKSTAAGGREAHARTTSSPPTRPFTTEPTLAAPASSSALTRTTSTFEQQSSYSANKATIKSALAPVPVPVPTVPVTPPPGVGMSRSFVAPQQRAHEERDLLLLLNSKSFCNLSDDPQAMQTLSVSSRSSPLAHTQHQHNQVPTQLNLVHETPSAPAPVADASAASASATSPSVPDKKATLGPTHVPRPSSAYPLFDRPAHIRRVTQPITELDRANASKQLAHAHQQQAALGPAPGPAPPPLPPKLNRSPLNTSSKQHEAANEFQLLLQRQLQSQEEFVASLDGQLSPSQFYDLDSFPSAASPASAAVELNPRLYARPPDAHARPANVAPATAAPVGSPLVGRKISAPPANMATDSKRPLNVNFYHIHGNTISITPAAHASASQSQQTPTTDREQNAPNAKHGSPQVQMMALFAKDKSVCSTDEEDEAARRARQAACWPRFLRCSGSNKQSSTPYGPLDKAPLAMDPLVAPLRDLLPSVDHEEHRMVICAWPFSKAFIDPLEALRTLAQQSLPPLSSPPSAFPSASASAGVASSSKLSRHASGVGARDDLAAPAMAQAHTRPRAVMAQSASLYAFNSSNSSASGIRSPQTFSPPPHVRQSSELLASSAAPATALGRRLHLAEIRPSSTTPVLAAQPSRAAPLLPEQPSLDSSGRGMSPIYEPVSVDLGSQMGPVLTPSYLKMEASLLQQQQQQHLPTSSMTRTRSTTGSRSPSTTSASAASSSSASLTSFAAAGTSPYVSSSSVAARADSPHRSRLPTGPNGVPKTLTSIPIDQPPPPIPHLPTSFSAGAALLPYSPQISTKQIDEDEDIL